MSECQGCKEKEAMLNGLFDAHEANRPHFERLRRKLDEDAAEPTPKKRGGAACFVLFAAVAAALMLCSCAPRFDTVPISFQKGGPSGVQMYYRDGRMLGADVYATPEQAKRDAEEWKLLGPLLPAGWQPEEPRQ
jgi:hypothetical protein